MDVQTKLISEDLLDDFVATLEDKGLSSQEINEFMLQIIAEVELEVVEELMHTLSDEKKELLQALVSQEATGEEIAKQLEIDEEYLEELEIGKLKDIVQELSVKLAKK